MRTSKWLSALSLAVALLCMALFTGCAQGRAQLLAAAAHADRVNNAESMSESRSLISMSAKTFSAQLLEKAAAAFSEEGREDFVLSPAAVYSALATVAACAGGETRRALTDAMETTYDDLQSGFPLYFRSLAGTDKGEEFDFGNLTLVNSIWLQDGTHVRDAGLKTLSESFFCHSYAADFQTDGRAANEAVRAFIAKQTNRLIDLDPNLPSETLFALVSALSLRDTWDLFGNQLRLTEETYAFGDTGVRTRLMEGRYLRGRVAEGDTYRYYYTSTYHGYRLKFLVPKEGFSPYDVLKAQTITAANELTDFRADDDIARIHYYTRCLFPSFTSSYDGDLKPVLSDMGMGAMFDPTTCDLSGLLEETVGMPVRCTSVRHAATLKVNRRGIEGAAVVAIPAAGAAGPDGYEEVYEDFVIDRPFAYLLTDREGDVIFAGTVHGVTPL